MNRRLDSRKLETFRVVAQIGKISAAAKVLHLSQPAVTAQVRQLEEECGLPLFVRSPAGVTLNESGQRLLEYAQKVDHLLHEAAYAVHEGERTGEQLVLAASQTTAASVVPRFVAAFRARRPGLGVRVDVGNTTEVLHWLSTGAVPLAVVEGLPRAAGARLEPFLEDELIPVASTSAPREVLALESAEDLGTVPVVWREVGSGSRAVVERALEKAGMKRKAHPGDLALGSNDAVRAAVLLGLGLGFMSKWTVQGELEAGTLRQVRFPDLRVVRSFAWALPAGEIGGVAGQFLKESRRVVADLWSKGEKPRR